MNKRPTANRAHWTTLALTYASSVALIACLALLTASLGCRTEHLGAKAGDAYKNAFAQQHNPRRKSAPMGLSASDARTVLQARAGKKTTAGKTAAAQTGLAGVLSNGGLSGAAGGAGGSWPGASGNISLEAK